MTACLPGLGLPFPSGLSLDPFGPGGHLFLTVGRSGPVLSSALDTLCPGATTSACPPSPGPGSDSCKVLLALARASWGEEAPVLQNGPRAYVRWKREEDDIFPALYKPTQRYLPRGGLILSFFTDEKSKVCSFLDLSHQQSFIHCPCVQGVEARAMEKNGHNPYFR